MIDRDQRWMVRWRLLGSPRTLSREMLRTIPEACLKEVHATRPRSGTFGRVHYLIGCELAELDRSAVFVEPYIQQRARALRYRVWYTTPSRSVEMGSTSIPGVLHTMLQYVFDWYEEPDGPA